MPVVKRLLAFVLSLLLLTSSMVPRMGADQSVRLSALLTHYQEHKQELGQELSFLDFLIMHYASDSHHHKSPHHNHSRLPSFDSGAGGFVFAPVFSWSHELIAIFIQSTPYFGVPSWNARQVSFCLLQPPRC
ncbi:hypothetical protein GCM10023187_24660 [Nibrella viscosa]|uniref:Uncharacterized protein n=1 Tax=Nibrella viscosa TaxID=1084524 RepID=A0ABP8KF76_9BACT